MPPRSERTALRERYDRRRSHVVSGAARMFAERGYDRTSVPQLAEALGLATGSLYHYFASKEGLLIAICDELMEPLLAETEALVASSTPPDARLRELVHVWVDHVVRHRDHMLVFQQERHMLESSEHWRKVRADRKRFERVLKQLLDEVSDAGLLALEDVRLTLAALLGMVNYTALWHRSRGPLSAAEIANGYLDLILAAPHE